MKQAILLRLRRFQLLYQKCRYESDEHTGDDGGDGEEGQIIAYFSRSEDDYRAENLTDIVHNRPGNAYADRGKQRRFLRSNITVKLKIAPQAL